MLTMPSIWSLLVSTLTFFIAAWYLRRFLIEQDLEKGFALNIVVMTLATLASFAAAGILGWVEHKFEAKKPVEQRIVPIVDEATLSGVASLATDAQSAVKETDN